MTNPFSSSEKNETSTNTEDFGEDVFLSSSTPPEIPDPKLLNQASDPKLTQNFENPYVGGASHATSQSQVAEPSASQSGGRQKRGPEWNLLFREQEVETHASVVPRRAAPVPHDPNMVSEAPKSWLTALLLCFFLGSFGAHNFYLGYKKRAITQLVLVVIGILTSIIVIGVLFILAVGIWAFVEFLMLLINADYRDAWGRPLVRN